jgi:hypothetical protein
MNINFDFKDLVQFGMFIIASAMKAYPFKKLW